MTDDSMEIVRGSGNVFRDFGYPDADVRQAKALLAAQIVKVLDQLWPRQSLSVFRQEGIERLLAFAPISQLHSKADRVSVLIQGRTR